MIIFSEFGGLCQHMQEGCGTQHSFSVLLPIFTQSLWCEYIKYHFNCRNFELCLYVSIWKPLLVYFNQCLGAVHSNCFLKFIFFMFFALFCKTLMQKLWKIMRKRAFLVALLTNASQHKNAGQHNLKKLVNTFWISISTQIVIFVSLFRFWV